MQRNETMSNIFIDGYNLTKTFRASGEKFSKQFKQAEQEMRDAGYKVSAGSWEDDSMVCVFSVETHGPTTYNHPKKTVEFNK